ncbi:hypothetical protein M0805_001923 [Coniferiporia weirii]|nr:hypothetical protein M0805_001923 [Coniferiporia weirii]
MKMKSIVFQIGNLDESVAKFRNTLVLCPPSGHSLRPLFLVNLANVLKARFDRAKQAEDLDECIACYQDALQVVLRTSQVPDYSTILYRAANAFRTRFDRNSQMEDLDRAIAHHLEALVLRTPGHPNRFQTLNNLGNALFTRFGRTNQMKDLNESIAHHRDALGLQPPRDFDRSIVFNSLGSSLFARYQGSGQMGDLDEAVSLYREVLTMRPPGHPRRLIALYNIGSSLNDRFQKLGQISDLEEAITYLRGALRLQHPGHLDDPFVFDKLGETLQNRFLQTRKKQDIDECITHYRAALHLRHPGNQYRANSLNKLADAIYYRFQRAEQMQDTEEPNTHHHGCDFPDPQTSNHPYYIMNIDEPTTDEDARLKRSNKMKDLEESIIHYRDALALRPPEHPCGSCRSMSLNNLANAIYSRFQLTGQTQDIEESIVYYRNALSLQTPGDPFCSKIMNSLAVTLHTCFKHGSQLKDLEEAISLYRDVLALRPPGHGCESCRSMSLNNLANSVSTRFEQSGQLVDLEESIALHREALALRPSGHLGRSTTLTNIGLCLQARFLVSGNIRDLEESIASHREALALRPHGHPDRCTTLSNIGICLKTRFHEFGQKSDIEEAISYHREALVLRPSPHPKRPSSLNNLANALFSRFKDTRQLKDLEESITYHRDSLVLRPSGHHEYPIALDSLGNSLKTRFQELGRIGDLEEAIDVHSKALALRPPGHLHRSSSLTNVGNALSIRFKHTRQIEDNKESIVHHRGALDLQPPGHPEHSASLNNLADSLVDQWRYTGILNYLEEAMHLYESSVDHVFSSALTRLNIAVQWAAIARHHHHKSALKAYRAALSLLHLSLAVCPTAERQHELLRGEYNYQTLALEAASCAIEERELTRAVEMLEQGRGLLISSMRGFRTPLDRLSGVDKTLADRFLSTSHQLEALATSIKGSSIMLAPNDRQTDSLEPGMNAFDDMLTRKRLLSKQLGEIITNIHTIPGFEGFLQATPYSTLQTAAIEGPVIMINHSRHRCDALIILHNHPAPVCIRLADDFYEEAFELDKQLSETRLDSGPGEQLYSGRLRGVLERLWTPVVSQVVAKLDELGIQKKSRIWWCPTSVLSALPLHAAGPVSHTNGKVKYLPDDYVSSYTPTLAALMSARANATKLSTQPQLLVVAQPGASLPNVKKEAEAIEKLGDFVTCLVGREATLDEVIRGLQNHNWVHFACHGHLAKGDPFMSSFELFDNTRLTLLDIIRSNLPNAELAILSACHSAEQTSGWVREEVLHLAAAIQFCGFRSVVGTMWSMDDQDGPFLARELYKRMLSEKETRETGFRRSARALCEVTKKMRGEKGMTIERWVNFVHIGA